MNKTQLFILICIVAAGAFLRFFKITSIPAPVSHDEAAIAYNAYSLLKTGKDEYGIPFPLLFRSFDDYKLPGMIYSTALSVWAFGLNELGVRFPSALFGTLSIIIFFLISKEFFQSTVYSLLSTVYFSLSPWAINFSRQNFESNGALFFLILGVYFLIKFNRETSSLIYAAISFTASIYFYYSVRLIIPFILLASLTVYFKDLKKDIKTTLVSVCTGLILIAPFVPSLVSRGGFERIKMVSVMNDEEYIKRQEAYSNIIAGRNTLLNRIIHNRRVALAQTIASNYIKNISYEHVFIKGTGRNGLVYRFELPLILAGIIFLMKSKTKLKWILITLLVSFPLPGAFSTNQPNALRTLPGAPILSLLSGLGTVYIFEALKNTNYKIVFSVVLSLSLLSSVTGFYGSYFTKFPYDEPKKFGDGQKQMVIYVAENRHQYDTVIISGYYWRPYIFTLFWQQYDPVLYHQTGTPEQFDKYIFTKAAWDHTGIDLSDPALNLSELTQNPDSTLFILAPSDFDTHRQQLRKIDSITGLYAKEVYVTATLISHP